MVLLPALLLLYPLSGALSDMSPISSRAILGSVVFVLLAGLGVRVLLDGVAAFRRRLAVPGALVIAAAITLAGAVSLGGYLDRYFGEYPELSANYWGWQEGAEEIIGRFVGLQNEYDELYMEGFFNAPHVFIPFYAGDRCPKCRIGEASRYQPEKRQLFAFRVESTELQKIEFRIVDRIFHSNGQPAFVLVEILGVR